MNKKIKYVSCKLIGIFTFIFVMFISIITLSSCSSKTLRIDEQETSTTKTSIQMSNEITTYDLTGDYYRTWVDSIDYSKFIGINTIEEDNILLEIYDLLNDEHEFNTDCDFEIGQVGTNYQLNIFCTLGEMYAYIYDTNVGYDEPWLTEHYIYIDCTVSRDPGDITIINHNFFDQDFHDYKTAFTQFEISTPNSIAYIVLNALCKVLEPVYMPLDIVQPDFTNNDYNFPVNVDSPESIESILSKIHATDDTDGDISNRVELVSTTYDSNNLVLGKHDLNVKVSDTAGNFRTGTFYVIVFDVVPPVLSGINEYRLSYDSIMTVDDVLDNLSAVDNFTKIDLIITLKSDTYSENNTTVGNYEMRFTSTDEAGNTSDDYIISFIVEDKKPAIITAPSVIEVSNVKAISLDQIKDKINVHDGYDGDITDYEITDYDTYYKNYLKVGNYPLTIKVEDSSGNITTFEMIIENKDGIQPDFYLFKDYVITITKATELTKEMIISYLSQIGEIDAEQVQEVSFELDSEEAGTYAVSLLMFDGSTYNCSIQVGEKTNVKKTFDFFDIIKPEFWRISGNDFVKNMFNPKLWNWLNWTALGGGIILVGLIVYLILKIRNKRKQKKFMKQFYN